MAKDNTGPKKKVTRQSWKPTGILRILNAAWLGFYSVFKVIMGAVATVLTVLAICLVVFVMALGDYLQGEVLSESQISLDGFDLGQNSMVYGQDENGDLVLLQKLYAETNSSWADYDEIPQAMIHAAVAIEDHRFFEHQGVDWFTTIKACVNMFVGSGDQFGGSSITQQLIKNLLLQSGDDTANAVTVQRKVAEIFRASALEKQYDKKVIITWYLNKIDLGGNTRGVKAAAEKYFGKELELLTPAECASIISITNNPSLYDPTRTNIIRFEVSEGNYQYLDGFQRNRIRKENTLWTMRNYGYLTEEEYQEALAQELVLKKGIDLQDRLADCPNEDCLYHGQVSTFVLKEDELYYCPQCDTLTEVESDKSRNVYSWYVDTVIEDVAADFAARDGFEWDELSDEAEEFYRQRVCGGGYHIYTPMNVDVQEELDTVYEDLSRIPTTQSPQQLQSGMVIIDNKTGDIVAMSGGVGEKLVFDAYNRATVNLQPGSSIKPLTIYAPGFEHGTITPASVGSDMPLYYIETAATETKPASSRPFPYNDDREYSYKRTIYRGIISSVNGIAVNTLNDMGIEYSFNFAKNKFRLNGLVEKWVSDNGIVYSDLGYAPLGMGAPTFGVSVREMATAYATFANDGVWREARTYLVVYSAKGEVVMENTQESEQILGQKAVEYMNYCLTAAVQSGTGTAAKIDGQTVAGKTGTTSSAKDRWFCGYTDYYTAAVWCGYDNPEVIKLTGNTKNPACRLFKAVLTPVHNGLEKVALYDSDNFEEIQVCIDCGKLATDACSLDARTFNTGTSRVDKVKVYYEDIPLESCDCHVVIDFCDSCNAVANEYCKLFAGLGQTTISKRALTTLTAKEVEDIAKAAKAGLESPYYADNFVYLVDRYGEPLYSYKGIFGDLNVDIDAPYLVCTNHTKEMWDALFGTVNESYEGG